MNSRYLRSSTRLGMIGYDPGFYHETFNPFLADDSEVSKVLGSGFSSADIDHVLDDILEEQKGDFYPELSNGDLIDDHYIHFSPDRSVAVYNIHAKSSYIKYPNSDSLNLGIPVEGHDGEVIETSIIRTHGDSQSNYTIQSYTAVEIPIEQSPLKRVSNFSEVIHNGDLKKSGGKGRFRFEFEFMPGVMVMNQISYSINMDGKVALEIGFFDDLGRYSPAPDDKIWEKDDTYMTNVITKTGDGVPHYLITMQFDEHGIHLDFDLLYKELYMTAITVSLNHSLSSLFHKPSLIKEGFNKFLRLRQLALFGKVEGHLNVGLFDIKFPGEIRSGGGASDVLGVH